MSEKSYEEEKAERDATFVRVPYGVIDRAYRVLGDADSSIRVFYPSADWAQRKGMQILMDEINEAQEGLLITIRAILNPDREDFQPPHTVIAPPPNEPEAGRGDNNRP